MSDVATCETVVVGAGVVGLAIAARLAASGREVIVLESELRFGTGTSSRNSEVIHAGIYYPAGSHKARLCVEGKGRLYAFCDERGVPFRRTGKLIIATSPDEISLLDGLRARAAANGVEDLQVLTRDDVAQLAPALRCVGAIFSPSTGIVDTHALMLALVGDIENAGGAIACASALKSGCVRSSGRFELLVSGAEPMKLECAELVVCAGLHASQVAASIAGIPRHTIPATRLCRGVYFSLQGRPPAPMLVYPVPSKVGLGIHLTIDLAGHARFGPDTEWIDDIDYRVDPSRLHAFEGAIRAYWPGLPEGGLLPAYAGIRPKVAGPNDPAADFIIQGDETHGVTGLLALYGIESPGLTASLAIAEEVVRKLDGPSASIRYQETAQSRGST